MRLAVVDDRAPVEDDYLVGVFDGGQSVGDGDRGAAFGEGVEGCLERGFGGVVEGRRGLVEDEDGRVSQDRAIARRCCSPPEKRCPREPTTVSRPSMSDAMCPAIWAASNADHRSLSLASGCASRRLSRMVVCSR